jgi:hypothetical protein
VVGIQSEFGDVELALSTCRVSAIRKAFLGQLNHLFSGWDIKLTSFIWDETTYHKASVVFAVSVVANCHHSAFLHAKLFGIFII